MRNTTLSDRFQYQLIPALFTFVASFIVALLLVFVFNMRTLFLLAFVGGIALILIFFLSGNTRLFSLLGLMLVIPLDLSKRFMMWPHFGGEVAIRIEATDVFLLALIFYWFRDLAARRLNKIHVPSAAIWWALLATWAVICLPFIFYRTLAMFEIIRMVKLFILCIVISNIVTRRRQFEFIVAILLLGALVQALYGLLQYVGLDLGLESLGQLGNVVTEQVGTRTASRVGAMLGHPNLLASYLIQLLPLAFILLFVPISNLYKLFCVIVLLPGISALVLTLSRAAWLGFALAIMILLGFTFIDPRMKRKYMAMKMVVILSLLVLGVVFSGPVIQKFTASQPSSIDVRIIWMKISKEMILDHYFIGLGLNSYELHYKGYDNSEIMWAGDRAPVVHNIYLLVWSEQGTVGFLLWMTILIVIYRMWFRNLRCKDEVLLAVNMGAMAGITAALTQGFLDWGLRQSQVLRVFWTLVGLIAAVYYWNQVHEADPPPTEADQGETTPELSAQP